MEFIKDKQKALEALNELVSSYGELKTIAESIDTILFDWVDAIIRAGECPENWHADTIARVKAIRDVLNEIEHT